MSSLLSLWLQNRYSATHCSNQTLNSHQSEIIKVLGGLRTVIMICLQNKYALNYDKQRNLLPLLSSILRQQRQENKKKDVANDANDYPVGITAWFNIYPFLNDKDLNHLSLTNHLMQTNISSYTKRQFGSAFPVLFTNDTENIHDELKVISRKISKHGTHYVSRLSQSGVIGTILSLTNTITDIQCIHKAIQCIHKIATFKRYGRYIRDYKDALIHVLCVKHFIGDIDEYPNIIRDIKLRTMNTIGILMKSRCYTPSQSDAHNICQYLIVDIFENSAFIYDTKIIVEGLNLMVGMLRCNKHKIESKEFVQNAIATMKTLLKRYLKYVEKDWIYHINIRVENIVFILRNQGRVSYHRFSSRKELIQNYNRDKYVTFGICDTNNPHNVTPYFKGNLALQPLIVANVLAILSRYSPISLDDTLIANIIHTLYIDNFVWKEKMFNSNYNIRSCFILHMIVCDVNILLNPVITESLCSLKPSDIDYIFWLIATSNLPNYQDILTHFFSLMTDKHLFVKHCNLSGDQYPFHGMNAFIELMPTKFRRIGIHKILHIMQQSDIDHKILRFTLIQSNFLKYLTDLMSTKNDNIYLGIRLINIFKKAIENIADLLGIRDRMHQLLYDVFSKNGDILSLPIMVDEDCDINLSMDPIQLLYETIYANTDILTQIIESKDILKCIMERVCFQTMGSIPFELLMCLSMIIAQSMDKMSIKDCMTMLYSRAEFVVLWIASIIKWRDKINVSSTHSRSVLMAIHYILKECKRASNIMQIQPILFDNFRLFLIQNLPTNKDVANEILSSLYYK